VLSAIGTESREASLDEASAAAHDRGATQRRLAGPEDLNSAPAPSARMMRREGGVFRGYAASCQGSHLGREDRITQVALFLLVVSSPARGRKPTSCSSVARKYGILFLRRIWLPSAFTVLRICAVCSWVRPRAW
jgi:hypothetical protein